MDEAASIVYYMFTLSKRVPDVIRSWNEGRDRRNEPLPFEEKEELDERVANGSIVIILESPHKDEYDYDRNFKPLYPAMSEKMNGTGKGIDDNLDGVLNDIGVSRNADSPVIICNPVQYQTSLDYLLDDGDGGGIDNEIRNSVWRLLFGFREIKEDFRLRIHDYDPQIILNACTSDLSHDVSAFLNEHFPRKRVVRLYHPSAGGWSPAKRTRLLDPPFRTDSG
jgi:hypothetical protein